MYPPFYLSGRGRKYTVYRSLCVVDRLPFITYHQRGVFFKSLNWRMKLDNSLTIQAGVVSKLDLDLPELVASGKTKVKKTNRAFRIWIEGTKLVKAGFDSSVAYTIDYDVEGGTIFLIIDPKGERKVTASRPIIDLHDQKVGEVFDAGDQIEVQYFDNGVIRFRRAI